MKRGNDESRLNAVKKEIPEAMHRVVKSCMTILETQRFGQNARFM